MSNSVKLSRDGDYIELSGLVKNRTIYRAIVDLFYGTEVEFKSAHDLSNGNVVFRIKAKADIVPNRTMLCIIELLNA